MGNLLTRSLSGIVYVALIVCAILFGGNWGFPSLICLFSILATMEFHSLCDSGKNTPVGVSILDSLGALVITLSPITFISLTNKVGPLFASSIPLSAFIIYLLARLIYQLYITSDKNPLRCMNVSLAGQLYIGLPLGCASLLYLTGGEALTLTMFLMIWLNDTGAYLTGTMLGKHRLFPRVSPKKSWEGFFGGLVFCVLCAVVLRLGFKTWSPYISLAAFCGYGVVAGIFATWGDLVESLIKRTLGVKDSGFLIPGHGGILDRIDSLLFVAPVTFLYMLVVLILNNQ